MIQLQNKNDKARIREVSEETWGQMQENGTAKGWRIISREAIATINKNSDKEIEMKIEDFIKTKDNKKTKNGTK